MQAINGAMFDYDDVNIKEENGGTQVMTITNKSSNTTTAATVDDVEMFPTFGNQSHLLNEYTRI